MKMIKNNKLLLKIFSGFIAVVLWFAITYTEDPSISQHIGRLSMVFHNEDKLAERGFIIVNKSELPSLSVTIRGKRSKVISALERVSANINVDDINSAGVHEVDVEYKYPLPDISISKEKYPTISLTIEELVSKDVPVRIQAKPNKKDKEHLIKSTHMETITVSGAQSLISQVAYAGIEIDETDITSDCTINYEYKLFDAEGNELDEQNVFEKSHENIPVTHTFYDKIELPVKVVLADNLSRNYTLKISSQDITNVAAGVLEDTDIECLEAVFERKHLENEDDTISLQIMAPEEIYLPDESQKVKIKYSISKNGDSAGNN